jgi:hypothetical protein
MKTMKESFDEELKANDETWDDIESNTMTEEDMMENDVTFTVWTKKSVYFPCIYDGFRWIGRVSRHPDGKPTDYVGGGG